MKTNKIPITRLKIAQICWDSLPNFVGLICAQNVAFRSDKDNDEIFVHADVFGDVAKDYPPDEEAILKDLDKQFCSFDYLMII